MNSLELRFAVDEKGNRISVLLDIQGYDQLLGAVEGPEPVHAYNIQKPAWSQADRGKDGRSSLLTQVSNSSHPKTI